MRALPIGLLLCLCLAGCARLSPSPARAPERSLFRNTAFGWSVQPPTGWRPVATGGNADPTTAPSVTFLPPGPGRSQDEYLAVRLCRSAAECVPPGAAAAPVTPGDGRSVYTIERPVTPARRVREVHTLLAAGGKTWDVMLSRPAAGGDEAEALYPAFRQSFRLPG